MPLFGALAGLTAAGLYSVVDELRVAYKIHAYQVPGTLTASIDYDVDDERFEGFVRGFRHNWDLDGGTLFPEKLVDFFAEHPDAREQWILMQSGIMLHDGMKRRKCETDIAMFGEESIHYESRFGFEEQQYIREHVAEAEPYIQQIIRNKSETINASREKERKIAKKSYRKTVFALVLAISCLLLVSYFAGGWLALLHIGGLLIGAAAFGIILAIVIRGKP